jgi:hypothetical protein
MLITGALVLGVMAPAAALVPIPDVCAFGRCIQFTHTTALAQIEALYNQAIQLQNESTNLKSLGNASNLPIAQTINSMTGAGAAVTALIVGNNAAAQTVSAAPAAARQIQKADSQSTTIGAQAQAETADLYLSTIAGNGVTANTLAAQQVVQKQNDGDARLALMRRLFSGKVSTTTEQF